MSEEQVEHERKKQSRKPEQGSLIPAGITISPDPIPSDGIYYCTVLLKKPTHAPHDGATNSTLLVVRFEQIDNGSPTNPANCLPVHERDVDHDPKNEKKHAGKATYPDDKDKCIRYKRLKVARGTPAGGIHVRVKVDGEGHTEIARATFSGF